METVSSMALTSFLGTEVTKRTTGGPGGPPVRHGSAVAGDQVIKGMIRSATMFATLIIGLIAGPAVSL
jgi:hypothetical protein